MKPVKYEHASWKETNVLVLMEVGENMVTEEIALS